MEDVEPADFFILFSSLHQRFRIQRFMCPRLISVESLMAYTRPISP
jgi:hypothetical protein